MALTSMNRLAPRRKRSVMEALYSAIVYVFVTMCAIALVLNIALDLYER